MDAQCLRPLCGIAIVLSLCGSTAFPQFLPIANQALIPQPIAILPPAMSNGNWAASAAAHMHPMVPANVAGPGQQMTAPLMLGQQMLASQVAATQPWLPAEPADAQAAGVSAIKRRGRRGQTAAESENFIVFAKDQAFAQQVAQTAERQRRELAVQWLGNELPPWNGRCPIHVNDGPSLGAGGETRFIVQHGQAGDWMMSVQGTRERILDSVLPHEISHTIFATYFGRLNKYVPRWADEGAATTVEHEEEKSKHRYYLRKFLQTGRGLAFNTMFQLKEYPQDILPLYAQGHSAVQFLIDQHSPQHFVKFLEAGMQSENWPATLQHFYAYDSIGLFQTQWNKWLLDGSPDDLMAYAPLLQQKQLATAATQVSPSNEKMALAVSTAPQAAAQELALQAAPQSLELTLTPAAVRDEPSIGIPAKISLDDAIALNRQTTDLMASANGPSSEANYFQRKLRQTSGQPATPIPPHNNDRLHDSADQNSISLQSAGLRPSSIATRLGGPATDLTIGSVVSSTASPSVVPAISPPISPPISPSAMNATARPQPAQGPSLQVLDWGPNGRLSGGQSDRAPIYR